MNKKTAAISVIIVLLTVGICHAGDCSKNTCPKQAEKQTVDSVLKQLKQKTSELESYQCRLEYLVRQPLFESQTLRKGELFYQKFGAKSKLRINFQTEKQDDEKEQKQIQQYIFDGTWLTHIDYQIKEITRRQLAEPNEPIDAFELASRNFPIIGFTGTDKLQDEFEITMADQKESKKTEFIQLLLKVKPNSIYKDDYKTVDFWMDKKTGLAAKIAAVSIDDDIYQIKLIEAKVNKELKPEVFDYQIPEGFGRPQIVPLKKKAE